MALGAVRIPAERFCRPGLHPHSAQQSPLRPASCLTCIVEKPGRYGAGLLHSRRKSRLALFGGAGSRLRRERRGLLGLSIVCSDNATPNATASSVLPESKTPVDALSRVFQTLVSVRARVVGMVALALLLCNADRVIMSVAVVPLSAANGWGEGVVGVIQSSFLWGYMITPILGGALADRFGGVAVLSAGMALWSFATALTPWAAQQSLPLLFFVRVLMGLGEGVALPCMNNMVSRWVPKGERARAVGVSMAGFHLGSVVGLLLAPILMAIPRLGVFGPFLLFAAFGAAWLATWTLTITPEPRSHPSISAAELALITGQDIQGSTRSPMTSTATERDASSASKKETLIPIRLLLSKAPTWAIIIANSTNNWGYFVLLSWMPVYFFRVLGVDLRRAAWFSAAPWAAMAVTGLFAGAAADALLSRGMGITRVRKIMQSVGFLGPAVSLFGLSQASTAAAASAWLTLALSLSSFSQAGFLVNFQDIGPRYAGILHGMSNTAGTMAGIMSTASTGLLVEQTGSFKTPLNVCILLYIFATIFWNFYATGERVFE